MVAVILLVLAVLAAGAYLGYTQYERLCVAFAVAQFEREPSQAGADLLVDLLDKRFITPQQADRILPLLLTPTVTQEPSYPFGSRPAVQVSRPFELAFRHTLVDMTEHVHVTGCEPYGTGANGLRALDAKRHTLSLYPKPERPGTYALEIHYSYRLTTESVLRWHWKPTKEVAWPRRERVAPSSTSVEGQPYECRIVVPVTITVVRQ
jgi:hypothetical protein